MFAPRVTPREQPHRQRERIVRNVRKNGAGDPDRTDDLLITNQLLYQLSYAGSAWRDRPRQARPESRMLARPLDITIASSVASVSPTALGRAPGAAKRRDATRGRNISAGQDLDRVSLTQRYREARELRLGHSV
jgi:hypothetical protein